MSERLQVYQKAVHLADRVTSLAEGFPRGYYFLVDGVAREGHPGDLHQGELTMLSRVLCSAMLAVCVSVTQADMLTFDNLGTENLTPIGNGYGGLHWSNFLALDSSQSVYKPSGFLNGTVSGHWVAFNGWGESATVSGPAFNFDGVYLTAAWHQTLNVNVKGYYGTELLFNQTVPVNYDTPTWFAANYVRVDMLVFHSGGGADVPGDGGDSVSFAMDNFTFHTVPVPGAALLAALGLGLVGWLKRRIA